MNKEIASIKEPDYSKCSRKLGRFQEKILTIKEIAQGHLEAIHNKSTIKRLIIERQEREKSKVFMRKNRTNGLHEMSIQRVSVYSRRLPGRVASARRLLEIPSFTFGFPSKYGSHVRT